MNAKTGAGDAPEHESEAGHTDIDGEASAAPEEAAPPAPARRGGWGPALATGFLAIAVALGIGWWLHDALRAAQRAAEGAGEAAREAAARAEAGLGAIEGRLDSLQADVAEAAARAERANTRFGKLSEVVSALGAKQRVDDRDWVLAQVEYLLFAANERLQLVGDAGAALAAMAAADERLEQLQDPALLPVREQLVADMNALRAVPRPDISGHALYLADLIRRIDELPLQPLERLREQDPAAAERGDPAGEASGEGEGEAGSVLGRAWNELVALIDVQPVELPDKLATTPDGRRLLREALRTELVSARLAVVRRDTGNLRASLEVVTTLIERYFDEDASVVAAVLRKLREMQDVELAPELPEIGGSLNAIRAFRART